MTLRQSLISFILVAILVLASWTTFLNFLPEPAKKDNSMLPDGYMENVTATILDKTGIPSVKIVTPKLTHYILNDKSELDFPRITLYRYSASPWIITANSAITNKGITDIFFKNDVVIKQEASPLHPFTTIKTISLTVFPQTQIAQTQDEITMYQPNVKITGLGLYANMSTGNINLLSKTRGEYVSN